MNDVKEHFTKKNVLICWNGRNSGSANSYADQLIKEGFEVVTTYSDFVEKEKGFSTTSNLNQISDKRKTKKGNKEENKINGLVVLCELTWGLEYKNQYHNSPLYAMSGIEFVMELRRNNCILPVVFVSFLSRKQQLNLSTRYEIISTQILGHYYLQLPSAPSQWIETLNFSGKNAPEPKSEVKKELTDIELEDVKSHFCDPEGMLRELNHDLRKYLDATKPKTDRDTQFEYVFRKIGDIVGPTAAKVIEEKRSIDHDTDKKYEEKIKSISTSIQEFIAVIKTERPKVSIQTTICNVIFLDDEMHIDPRLNKLIELMRINGCNVQQFTDPNEALKEVKDDKDNLIDIIISDHRIWNQMEMPKLMDQPQGYSFLKDCAGQKRTYTYVVFSALDRNFLMTQFDLKTKTLYKNGVLANESSMLNFVQDIRNWGNSNQNSLAIKFSSNMVFAKGYNWYRNNNNASILDNQINELTNPSISRFDELQNRNHHVSYPTKCVYDYKDSCEDCGLFNVLGPQIRSTEALPTLTNIMSYYKNPEDWDPNNSDHIQNLLVKFAARRLYLFYYFTLDKINCKHREHIAKHLVRWGRFTNPDGNIEKTEQAVLNPSKDIWLTVKHLKPTPTEIIFLQQHNLI